MVELLLPRLQEVLLQEVMQLLQSQRKRRRKKVRITVYTLNIGLTAVLMKCTEKEESDEDMGFGLFD